MLLLQHLLPVVQLLDGRGFPRWYAHICFVIMIHCHSKHEPMSTSGQEY